MLVAHTCRTCRVAITRPATARLQCGVCRQPLVLESTGGSTSVLSSSGQLRSGMQDFFTIYLPMKVDGLKLAESSSHGMYMNELLMNRQFQRFQKAESAEELEPLIDRTITKYGKLKRKLKHPKIVWTDFYNQSFDLRLFTASEFRPGWCLGMSAFWLKHRRQGVDVFPDVIYRNEELSRPTGAPIKLMENQSKMTGLEAGRVDVGGTSRATKNALDYIAGGRATNFAPVVNINMMESEELNAGTLENLVRRIQRRLSRDGKGELRFLVGFRRDGGGKHMMALDLESVAFFDPNYGVFTAVGKDWEILLSFLFLRFFPLFYRGVGIRDFTLYRTG